MSVASVFLSPSACERKADWRGPCSWEFTVVRKPTTRNRKTIARKGPT
jgi:hypothetical protein